MDQIPVHFEHDDFESLYVGGPVEISFPSDAMFPPAILADLACAHEMLKQLKGETYWLRTGKRWKQLDQWTYDTLCQCAVDVTLARIEA